MLLQFMNKIMPLLWRDKLKAGPDTQYSASSNPIHKDDLYQYCTSPNFHLQVDSEALVKATWSVKGNHSGYNLEDVAVMSELSPGFHEYIIKMLYFLLSKITY